MRPTGKLHIGHYFGALQNWVRLQNEVTEKGPSYECFYFIADWHALTSDYADTSAVAQNTIEIVTDYLAAGLDPSKSVIFQQSLDHETAVRHLLLGMVSPLRWRDRVPTYKEAFENVTNKDLHTYGFLGYPCLQTADIVMYSEPGTPLFVPVGEDQVSHVEISREIVRRFNFYYGFGFIQGCLDDKRVRSGIASALSWKPAKEERKPVVGFPEDYWEGMLLEEFARKHAHEIGVENTLKQLGDFAKFVALEEVLTEPAHLLTLTPRIPGLDGRKMSKSYGNAITLSESDEDIRKKSKVMVTDPARKRRTDPGNPDVCPVYDWHKLFSPPETLTWAAEGCRSAGIGCIQCKAKMADHLIQWIAPIRQRRVEYEKNPARVLEVIDAGSTKARDVAQKTMSRVREAVFNWKEKREEVAQLKSTAQN